MPRGTYAEFTDTVDEWARRQLRNGMTINRLRLRLLERFNIRAAHETVKARYCRTRSERPLEPRLFDYNHPVATRRWAPDAADDFAALRRARVARYLAERQLRGAAA